MKTYIHKLVLMLWAFILLGACTKTSELGIQNIPSPTRSATICGEFDHPPSEAELATPYAIKPAAGICADALDENIASVNIWPDVPEPRCLVVSQENMLRVINKTGENVQVQLGPFHIELGAGETYTFDCPLGNYLAPGVHQIMVTPFGGPEIWLKN
ncbi:MAG: hypothetical protein PVF74_10215 [Anaerolineales bacterium]|jgi:hypothetical protein